MCWTCRASESCSTPPQFAPMVLQHVSFFCRHAESKASLTSHRTCTYVLVTEKNRLICKGPSRHTCDFRTKYQGRTGPAMKIGMHIFPACTQCVHMYLISDTLVGRIHIVFTCKSLLTHYQATFIFFNDICSTLTSAYTYDGM